MQNGWVSKLRILGSTLVSILGVAGAVYLLSQNIEVPPVYWSLCIISVIGVSGAEAVGYLSNLTLRKE